MSISISFLYFKTNSQCSLIERQISTTTLAQFGNSTLREEALTGKSCSWHIYPANFVHCLKGLLRNTFRSQHNQRVKTKDNHFRVLYLLCPDNLDGYQLRSTLSHEFFENTEYVNGFKKWVDKP